MRELYSPPQPLNITPRPYQREALDALDYHMRTKETNPCVVIPTGGGKSLLMAWAIQQWKQSYPPFRVCILAHRKELVEQNSDEMKRLLVNGDIGVYSAALKRRDISNSILFASIDSVYDKWGKFAPFDLIIVDEAHRIPPSGEGKYRQFITGCQSINKNLKVAGFTATPFRMNCGPICHKDHILNEICYEANIASLIAQGYLCKLRSKVGDVQADLTNVKKNSSGDYIEKSLAAMVDIPEIVQKAIQSAMQIIIAENRKSIMFFCINQNHCEHVSMELRKYGWNVPMVTGKTPIRERERIVEQFKAGRIRAISNINVYTDGFNAKRVDCIVLLRPTLSAGLYMQMVGRGLRTHESKQDCLVLDYAHCIEAHGPIDCIDSGEIRVVECGDCGDSFSRAIRKCPNCGWEIPKQEVERMEQEDAKRRMHEEKISNRNILGGEPEVLTVNEVFVNIHRKPNKPDSIRVQYRCGVRMFREWICLDHDGYAGEKARQWWRYRFGAESLHGLTVATAMADLFLAVKLTDMTKTITVINKDKYWEILDYNIQMLKEVNHV